MNSSEIATVEEAAMFFTEQAKLRPDWKIKIDGIAVTHCDECNRDCNGEVSGDAIRASVNHLKASIVIQIG